MVSVRPPFNMNLAISPDDAANLTPFTAQQLLTAAVYVGTTGDVVAVEGNGAAVTWKNVPAGTFLPIAVKRINAINTTALNLIACYWI